MWCLRKPPLARPTTAHQSLLPPSLSPTPYSTQHNKRREELHRLQEKHSHLSAKLDAAAAREAAAAVTRDRSVLGSGGAAGNGNYGDGLDDGDLDLSSSSSDDEPDDVRSDVAFLEALAKLKKRDASIYDPETRLFGEEGEEEEEEEEEEGEEDLEKKTTMKKTKAKKEKKEKPVLLKDALARQAIEHGPDAESSDEERGGDSDDERRRPPPPRSYVEQQAALKADFLKAAASGSESESESEAASSSDEDEGGRGNAFGGVLKKKGRKGGDELETAADVAPALLDEAFGGFGGAGGGREMGNADADIDERGEAFLRDYIGKRVWAKEGGDGIEDEDGGDDDDENDGAADNEDGRNGSGLRLIDALDEDEAYMRASETFEEVYNFRFEEPGGGRLMTHPRDVPGAVRKESSKRAAARAARAARVAEAKARNEAEIRRLKTLKRREIEDKLEAARAAAGVIK